MWPVAPLPQGLAPLTKDEASPPPVPPISPGSTGRPCLMTAVYSGSLTAAAPPGGRRRGHGEGGVHRKGDGDGGVPILKGEGGVEPRRGEGDWGGSRLETT